MPSLVLARIRVPVLSFRIALQPTTQRRYWFLVDSGLAPESVSPGAREIGIHISPGGANSLGRTSFVSKKLEAIIELNVLFSGEPRSLNSRRERARRRNSVSVFSAFSIAGFSHSQSR